MTLPIVVIRPQPGCAATLAAGRAMGLAMQGFPLFAVRAVPWRPPLAETVDAVIIGSANAVRHAGPDIATFRAKPVYAVGEATAAAAREAGFQVAGTGRGGLQSLLDTLRGPLRLLRLAGAEHVPLATPLGITVETRVVYDLESRAMPAEMRGLVGGGALVLLHSAAAAGHFARECDRLGLRRAAIRLAALGPRIAAAAGEGWGTVVWAAVPDEPALLALAADLCHPSARTKER